MKGLIRRSSSTDDEKKAAVITDTSIVNMIDESLKSASGCLFPYRNLATLETDFDGICRILVTYWTAVKNVFPDAWGKDPRHSRLMHSAGIEAMGVLMDRIYARVSGGDEDGKVVQRELEKVAPECRWTKGTWDSLGVAWNEIQSTPRDIKKLQDALVRIYATNTRR